MFLQNSQFEEIVMDQAVGYAIVVHKLYTKRRRLVSGMARPAGKDSIEVRDGVYIKMRDNGIWQVHFKLDGAEKAVRRSLKTKDLNEAKTLALDAFEQARLRQLSGRPQHAVSFETLCAEYLASLPAGNPKDYHAGRIRLHLLPFFKSRLLDISAITDADVLDYLQWRPTQLTKDGKEPKADTINRESPVLRGLIKFAVRKRYLTKDSAPDVPNLKAIKDRRSNFTRDQLETLIETAEARIDETKNAVIREQRQLLHDWIIVLLHTGLRTGEATKLQWSDVFIDLDEPYLHAKRGKTKPRNVVLDDPAVDSLKAIKSRQRSHLSKHGKKLTNKHHVFSLSDPKNQDLKPVKSFRTSFKNLLEACSLNDSDSELPLSPYSLRHSYATIRIEEGTRTVLLKDQMGTGETMIEKHYGHVKTREQRAELTKIREKSTSKSSDKSDVTEKMDAVIAALNKDKAETVVDVVRQQVLKEWLDANYGKGPDPTAPGDEEIFEGLVYERCLKLGHGELYEPPDDLPDSLRD